MKIYLIYKMHIENLENSLYAFTTERYLKNEFFRYRDNTLFTCVVKEATKKEIDSFKNNHSSMELYIVDLETKNPENISQIIKVPMVMTYSEYMNVFKCSENITMELFKYVDSVSESFNVELLKALTILEYFIVYRFNETDERNQFLEGINTSMSRIKADMYGIFMYFYNGYFKKEE